MLWSGWWVFTAFILGAGFGAALLDEVRDQKNR